MALSDGGCWVEGASGARCERSSVDARKAIGQARLGDWRYGHARWHRVLRLCLMALKWAARDCGRAD